MSGTGFPSGSGLDDPAAWAVPVQPGVPDTRQVPAGPTDAQMLDWLARKLFERKWGGTIGRPSSWYMAGPHRHVLQAMRGEDLRAAIASAMKEHP
jgi:hypothetical protein